MLVFATETGRCRYRPKDLALAQELASHAALAVDNARLYQEVQQALQAHNEFLSVAAHELTGPLVGLSGVARLLASRITGQHPTGAGDQRMLQVLTDVTQQLHRLIDALTDFSNIQAGYFSLRCQPVDLCALARHVVEEVHPTPQHTIRLTQPDEALVIDGDVVRLERVLHNLLQNAIKYSPEGGQIDVRLEQRDDEAYLAVQDNGIGIPQAAQAQLFQRFYRASNATSRNIRGLGIGL